MRILSNRSTWIVCFFLALFTMTGGDVALSQGRKGTSATRSIRESVTRFVKAAITQQERAAVDDAVEAPSQGQPRLRQTSGPEGGIILTLFSNGSNLFAGTLGGGVFRSTNQGASWMAANTGLPPLTIATAFAASGTNLFVGAPGGVFRSSDNGGSWTPVNTGLSLAPLVNALATAGTNIFAVTESGVFRSTNQRANWTSANSHPGWSNERLRFLSQQRCLSRQ